MKNVFIHKGMWWLPQNPNEKIAGTLTISPEEHITLETIGVLGEESALEMFLTNSGLHHDVVWGIDSDAIPISVFGFATSTTQNTSCSFPLVKYDVQVVAVGAHIRSKEDVLNYDVKVRIPELPLWCNPNILQFSYIDNEYQVRTNKLNGINVNIEIEEGCELSFEGWYEVSQDNGTMSITIRQDTILRFSFDHPVTMKEAKTKVLYFEQFMSLATLSPIQCSQLWLIDKEKEKDPTKRHSIELFEKRLKRDVNNNYGEYLFQYETIKDAFPQIIRKWYEEKELFPIRVHLIDSISNKEYFDANDFLIVCQAVEGFYCRFIKNKENLSLIFSNLIDKFSDITIQEIIKDEIKYITDTRHHFSHLLPTGSKANVLDGKELYDLNHKLRKLLICCVLKLIGFSNDEMNTIFSNSESPYLRMTTK